ncbi:MAG: RNA polymerase-binding protein DksA [Gammaproteobacteria bacterium]
MAKAARKTARKKTAAKKAPRKKAAAKKTAAKKKAVSRKATAKKSTGRKKAVGKKTATKKKVAKKKATKKKAAAATKKTAATKAAAKKKTTAKKKAPAKKASAKKAPAKKAAAKKAAAKKTPAAKKKATAQKTAAGAAPAKARSRRKTKPARNVAVAAPVNGTTETAASPSPPRTRLVNLEDVTLPDGYVPSPDEEYMSPQQLLYFRNKLRSWRDELIVESQETLDHLRSEIRDVGDEAERASRESDNILELRTRDRYRKLLKKIDDAIKRIEDGSYGYCEETGEEIGLGRLEARPIATLTVDAQERREMFQRQFRDDR